ncbi:hypothetical protein [Pasteurella sp. PK-2025]|uniref:hypothetical protein n=1 Tax=Pasteurella sp. PK-2025 TaxID=3413133 RepID=UPI003C71309C
MSLRTINFIAENGKKAVILKADSDLSAYLDLEKRMPESHFEGLAVQFDKDLNVAKVNGLPFDEFLAQTPTYEKASFEKEFKYCCIANDVGGNYITLDVTVESHCPANTNAYGLDIAEIETQLKGEIESENLKSQIQEVIETFNDFAEEAPKAKKFTSLIFEVKYFRFSGEQFPVRKADLSGEHEFVLDKSSRLVYEFDFNNAEELISAICSATEPTNLQLWQEPVNE